MAVLALARARDSTPCELSLVIDGTEHRVAIDASATPALAHCGTATHCNQSQARVRQVRIAASYGSEF